ncbi:MULTISPECIES: hypothetical protein [Maricaulis]|uniref:Uncharacterized protein n=1 Tax=Maricaulis maris TaxID=74318 RepID=A0A495D6J6_9PROT|nr:MULTISPECIES: hypothetical protein [Maricaulis]RKQ96580.1 hypothetical protein C7435_1912 [Maricaulis maris]
MPRPETGRWEIVALRWGLIVGISYWALTQLGSATRVLIIKFGDAVSAGIDPTLVIIVDNMGMFGAALTVANAVAYSGAVALLVMRMSAALPVYAAALVFDLTGWVIYSTHSLYDFWSDSSNQIEDWVANGLLLVGLIGLIILRQAGALPKRLVISR